MATRVMDGCVCSPIMLMAPKYPCQMHQAHTSALWLTSRESVQGTSQADRNTALLAAAKEGDAAKCGLLAAVKADVNCRNDSNYVRAKQAE